MLLRLPGEDAEVNDAALIELAGDLATLPPEVAAVEVDRWEDSASGRRSMPVVRAWRADRLGGLGEAPDDAVRPEGPRVRHRSVALEADRSAWSDLPGLACRAERAGDWLTAERTWAVLGEGDGPLAGYGRLRAAVAHARLRPRSPAVRDGLVQALAACPALPEAALRLAQWYLRHRRVEDAVAWGAMADAIPTPAEGVPHLEGAARWLVPARLARWVAPVDPERASLLAAMALDRSPPAHEVGFLATIAGHAGPASGEHVDGPRATGSPA